LHFAEVEILLALIEADGQIVSTKELFRRLWPRTCVAETNLRVHMYKLRRALGDNASAIASATGHVRRNRVDTRK
jgi:DNA-binding winged helix-turn-helix (wHTH) protein